MDELASEGFEVFRCGKKGNRNAEGKRIAIFSEKERRKPLLTDSELTYLSNVVNKLRRRPGPIGGRGLGGFEIFWCDKNGDRNPKGNFIAVVAGNRWRMTLTYGELTCLDNAISNFQPTQTGGGEVYWIPTGMTQ